MKAQASNNSFKQVLESMEHIDRLNFMWMYDQYVQTACSDPIEGWQAVPETMEGFYNNIYKHQIHGAFREIGITIQIGDIVFIGNGTYREAIGHYGKVQDFCKDMHYKVLYRHAAVNGNINPGVAVVSRDDISLIAKGKKK